MRFSQRNGITPVSKEVQLNNIDEDLKNGLWNIYDELLLKSLNHPSNVHYSHQSDFNHIERSLTYALWHNFFKWLLDSAPTSRHHLRMIIKQWYFKAKWHEVYDLIQFCCDFLRSPEYNIEIKNIENSFNVVLEREYSGYRFINGYLAPIINEYEISELSDALTSISSFSALKGCNDHLEKALSMLSDKLNPDYRNSIKESISAVESLAKIISGKTSDTLNGAIDRIKGKLKIHRNLEQGLKSLYNYTSDGDGIRHGMMEESTCDFEDAKFMLISCSAFINYLITKANKVGIEFNIQ